MLRTIAKGLFERFGYEVRRKIVRHVKDAAPTPDVSPDVNGLLLPTESRIKDLPIMELHKQSTRWGFVQCLAGDQKFLMFLGGRDDGVALRFLHNGCYEKKTMSLWVNACKSAKIIIDIGAHTGSYSIAAKLSNPEATVLSFEPHYLNYSRLSLNLRANELRTDQIYMLAVSDSNKKTVFSVPRGSEYHSSGGYVGIGRDRDNYIVTCVALDNFIRENLFHEIGLIKIDTEGHEVNCLGGMKRIINEGRPTIFFECITSGDSTLKDTLKGYEIFQINDSTGDVVPVQSIVPILDAAGRPLMNSINRVAIHPSRRRSILQ